MKTYAVPIQDESSGHKHQSSRKSGESVASHPFLLLVQFQGVLELVRQQARMFRKHQRVSNSAENSSTHAKHHITSQKERRCVPVLR